MATRSTCVHRPRHPHTLEYLLRVVPQPAADTALHSAVWHNNLSQLSMLLDAGAPVDAQDAENHWCAPLATRPTSTHTAFSPRTPLHKAIYLGNIRCAVRLLQADTSLSLTDSKVHTHAILPNCTPTATCTQGRTPLDLASHELKTYLRGMHVGDVFSWGHGANYQLGTGATGVAVSPARVDAMATRVVAVGAGKFHSVAVAADGRLFTWGFGRGGRLGMHTWVDTHTWVDMQRETSPPVTAQVRNHPHDL